MRFWISLVSVALLTAAPKWKERYVEVNGVKLHYVEQGKGPLILFLHGFPEFWYEWKTLLPEFARDHHAVAPDMRGYNLSGKPEKVESYALQVLVEDVGALAQKLGAKKFVLVGHDWGGVVAWAFAAAHPEMLDKLIIVNAPHPTVFSRELLKGWATDEDRKMCLEHWNRGLTGGLNYYRAAGLRSTMPQNSALSQPMMIDATTLVIWGEKDTALLTGNLEGMERYVKNLRIERIPEGSHWVIHEKPDQVIHYIRDFLER